MNDILKNAFESIDKMYRPDLEWFIQSEGYKVLCAHSDQYYSIHRMLKGKEVTVIGDVRSIEISGKNRVGIVITYSLVGDMVYTEQKDIFEVTDESMKKYIRMNLLPLTGIELIAKYTGKSVFGLEGGVPFEVVKINKINQKLKYGYYVCAGDNPYEESGSDMCNHNWGYNTNKFDKNYCCLCGSKLKYIENVYEEVM